MRSVKLMEAVFLAAAVCCLSINAQDQGFKWVNELPDSAHPRLRHGTFHSTLMDVEVGYVIYLPPGYEDPNNARRRYPVVYYLHGGRQGTEVSSIAMTEEFDRRIQSGVVPPRIYVFVNGGKWSHYDHQNSLGESAFVDELIPHIDRRYRTIASRSGRGIEGFSAGGRGTARIIFKHPDLFCSAVPMGGGHQHEKQASENNGEVRLGTVTIKLQDRSNNTWDLARLYASRSGTPPLEILVVVGTRDFNYESNVEWMDHLQVLGIPFQSCIVPGAPHSPRQVYQEVGDQIMKFHERCFAREETQQKLREGASSERAGSCKEGFVYFPK